MKCLSPPLYIRAPMRVAIVKFGGNTVNDAAKLDAACSTVSSIVERGEKVVAVVSAVRGVTDTLKDAVDNIEESNFDEYFPRFRERLEKLHAHSPLDPQDTSELEQQLYNLVQSGKKPWIRDSILVKGEEFFSRNFAQRLEDKGVETELVSFDSPEFPLLVYGYFSNARVDLENTRRMCKRLVPLFRKRACICLPGFGGVDAESGRVKTLRRGGSDAAATALGYGFSASSLWIVTDVNGIKRAYTREVKDAPTIPCLCAEELRDAGVYGAKVPNEAAVRPLMLHCPHEAFIVRYDDVEGARTQIVDNREANVERPVELAAQREVMVYEFNGEDMHARVSRLELKLDEQLVDFISLGGGDYTRKLVISSDQEPYVDRCLTESGNGIDVVKSRSSLVGVVGKGMVEAPGIIARMGGALARGGINIYYQFDVSPISCGVLVDRQQAEDAVELLYEEFELSAL